MKIRTQSKTQGSALVLALVTALVIGVTLASYLTLVSSQNTSVMRSLAWNNAVPMAEAGIEEALTQIHYNGITNLAANSWTHLDNGLYYKRRDLGDSYCEVTIKAVEPPEIVSTAFVPAPLSPSSQLGMILGQLTQQTSARTGAYLKRRIRVNTKHEPFFSKAMVAKFDIDLKGNNVGTDSFNSTDTDHSTNGKYDPAKALDHGDVATNSELINSLKVGNANIKGNVATGPNGIVEIGSNGSVGDKAWVDGKNEGIQPGHVSDDMNIEFPDVQLPSGTPTMVYAGTYTVGATNDYTYVLNGDPDQEKFLKSTALTGKVHVSGKVALWVTDTLKFAGSDFIYLAPNASLRLFVGAPDADLSGNGVLNSGSALNFQYLGLNSNTSLSFAGNSEFTGTIYAPYATFTLNGSGNKVYDFVGASVTSTVQMNGHFNFHYDEALDKFGPLMDYYVARWNEVDPNSPN